MPGVGVIIVAGGSGSRMGAGLPKQFLRAGGKEILVHTLGRFVSAVPDAEIVIVLPEEFIALWREIAARHGLEGTHRCCAGGDNRFLSVKKGLEELGQCDYIAVHDGVRPLVSEELINRCIATAESCGTAVPVTEPVDSFRIMSGGKAVATDRTLLRAVQTPQVFRADIIRKAYDTEYSAAFTDDASVVERYGAELAFCRGEYRNIKVTRPDDLIFVEAILNTESCIN